MSVVGMVGVFGGDCGNGSDCLDGSGGIKSSAADGAATVDGRRKYSVSLFATTSFKSLESYSASVLPALISDLATAIICRKRGERWEDDQLSKQANKATKHDPRKLERGFSRRPHCAAAAAAVGYEL